MFGTTLQNRQLNRVNVSVHSLKTVHANYLEILGDIILTLCPQGVQHSHEPCQTLLTGGKKKGGGGMKEALILTERYIPSTKSTVGFLTKPADVFSFYFKFTSSLGIFSVINDTVNYPKTSVMQYESHPDSLSQNL